MNNYDERQLEKNGMSLERYTAVEIMEYLGVKSIGDSWYRKEDEVTNMIIEIVDEYLQKGNKK